MRFNNVRVPKENMLLGVGRGFEISQLRLGPGRIHHCMRSIGKAEIALELMIKRAGTREAFGKPIAKLGKNLEVISRARIEINAMRLMPCCRRRKRWTCSATRKRASMSAR
jgi:acyl-CoA dehydrogenase